MSVGPFGGGNRLGFSSAQRLKTPHDFFHARKVGRKLQTAHFVRYCLENPDGPSRLGITVSRKVGGAVARNRVKRLVREYFRLHQEQMPKGTDFSIIAKPGAAELEHSKISDEMKILFGA